MITLIKWFILGFIGWLAILQAYHHLEGKLTLLRAIQQLPAIILGPVACFIGFIFIWDLLFDPPPRLKSDPNLLTNAIEDAKLVRQTALLKAKYEKDAR